MKKLFFILSVFILILISACNSTQNSQVANSKDNIATKQEINTEAVVFTGINDSVYRLSDFKGHVVILDFWASWCGPCKRSIPLYNKMYEKYGEQGLLIFGLDVNEPKNVIEQAAKNLEIKYNLGLSNNNLNQMFKVQGIPSMFIFDKQGKLVENFVGYAPELDSVIERLIKENL